MPLLEMSGSPKAEPALQGLARLERRLEEWMQRLEFRLDALCHASHARQSMAHSQGVVTNEFVPARSSSEGPVISLPSGEVEHKQDSPKCRSPKIAPPGSPGSPKSKVTPPLTNPVILTRWDPGAAGHVEFKRDHQESKLKDALAGPAQEAPSPLAIPTPGSGILTWSTSRSTSNVDFENKREPRVHRSKETLPGVPQEETRVQRSKETFPGVPQEDLPATTPDAEGAGNTDGLEKFTGGGKLVSRLRRLSAMPFRKSSVESVAGSIGEDEEHGQVVEKTTTESHDTVNELRTPTASHLPVVGFPSWISSERKSRNSLRSGRTSNASETAHAIQISDARIPCSRGTSLLSVPSLSRQFAPVSSKRTSDASLGSSVHSGSTPDRRASVLTRSLSQRSWHQKTRTLLQVSLGRQWSKMERAPVQTDTPLQRIVHHKYFDASVTLVVLMNALLVGAQVQHDARSFGERHSAFDALETMCTGFFTVELFLRISAQGREFIARHQRAWNLFDIFLVMVSWMDWVMSMYVNSVGAMPSSGAFLGKLLRVMRLARIMRIIRAVRFLAQLRIMAQMIVSSMLSLFWILVILFALMYVFAILLTQGATDYLQQSTPNSANTAALQEAYGDLFRTMYSLFKAVTGGRNWGEITDIMAEPGWVYVAIIIVYVFFTMFAVVNIVTGVFVDGAIELAKLDRTMMMQKQAKDRQATATHLITLLQEMDENGDGTLSKEEWKACIHKETVRELMEALKVDIGDAGMFFSMLDQDGNGEVDLVEFVEGMTKLSGDAKSSDIHVMMSENRRMLKKITVFMDHFERVLGKMEQNERHDTAAARDTVRQAAIRLSTVARPGQGPVVAGGQPFTRRLPTHLSLK